MSIHKLYNGSLREFASKVEFDDASQKLKINGTEHQVGGLYGVEGDVAYPMPDGNTVKQQILRSDIYICENDNDVQKSLNSNFSFKEVFTSWIPGGTYSSKWFGVDEYPATHNLRSLTEMLDFNASKEANPQSYNQLTSEIPASNWSLAQYYYQDPADHSLTALEPTGTITELATNNGGEGFAYWVYNDAIKSILQPMNCNDTTFYTSPQKYTEYELCVELSSFNGDDDFIGLIAAMNTDSSKRPHILTFMRLAGGNSEVSAIPNTATSCSYWQQTRVKWQAQMDEARWTSDIYTGEYLNNGVNMLRSSTGVLSSIDSDEYTKPTAASYIEPLHQAKWTYASTADARYDAMRTYVASKRNGWATCGGCRVWVKRTGNIIRARTTKLGNLGTPLASSEMTFDVSRSDVKDCAGNPVPSLTCFSEANGGGAIGFVTNSQAMTMYKVLKFVVPKQILKIHTNELVTYKVDGTTTTQSGKFNNLVGVGRLVKNLATGKTFFVGTNNYIKIGEVAV